MNRESSVVTPIRKYTPSKKQYQRRLDKAKAKASELEKEVSEANLKNAQLEKQLKVLKQAGLNDKEKNCKFRKQTQRKN